MIARVKHHKVVASAALAALLCALLLTLAAALFVTLQPVQSTLPGANDVKAVPNSSESGAIGSTNRVNLTRNLMVERHLELVGRR
jgi:ABC-type phosphate transport system substrate-binding protein